MISYVFLLQTIDHQTLCPLVYLLLPWSINPSISVSHICFSYLFLNAFLFFRHQVLTFQLLGAFRFSNHANTFSFKLASSLKFFFSSQAKIIFRHQATGIFQLSGASPEFVIYSRSLKKFDNFPACSVIDVFLFSSLLACQILILKFVFFQPARM